LSLAGSLLRIGIIITLINFATNLFNTADRLVILRFFSVADLGQYSLGSRIASVLVVGQVIGPVLYPRMTEQYGRSGEPKSLKPFVVFPTAMMSLTLPIVFGSVILLVPGFTRLLLPAYVPAIVPAQIYVFALFFVSLVTMFSYLMITLDRQLIYLILLLMLSGVNFILSWVFGALVGWRLEGVAMGTLITNVIFAAVLMITGMHLCHASADEAKSLLFRKTLAPVIFVAAVIFIISFFMPVGSNRSEIIFYGVLRVVLLWTFSGWLFFIALRELGWADWQRLKKIVYNRLRMD
jgi:O-antigen/teichoic acid export membrane protein